MEYVFLILGITLLLVCLFGNFRPLFSLVFGFVVMLAAYWLSGGSSMKGGLGGAILLLALGIAAWAVHLLYAAATNKKQKCWMPRRMRILLFAAGLGCAVSGLVSIEAGNIGDFAARTAVETSSERALVWSLKAWKENRQSVLEALKRREPGPDTLRLLSKSLPYIQCYSKYSEWEVLVHQPRGPERTEVAAQLLRTCGMAEFDSLIDLLKQNDTEILSLVARTPSVGEMLRDLISHGYYSGAKRLLQLVEEAEAADGQKNGSLADRSVADASVSSSNILSDPGMLSGMLQRGANPDAPSGGGTTPLMNALLSNQREAVRILLKAGANTEIEDNQGRTALFYAVLCNRKEFFQELLPHCKDVNRCDKSGMSLLHWAAWLGHGDIVRGLLLAGADVNAPMGGAVNTKNRPTAIFFAAQHIDPHTFSLLLNKLGPLPKAWVDRIRQHADAGFVFLHDFCDTAASDSEQCFIPKLSGTSHKTPLTYWCGLQARKNDVTMQLLNAGADLSRVLSDGDTVLTAAFGPDSMSHLLAREDVVLKYELRFSLYRDDDVTTPVEEEDLGSWIYRVDDVTAFKAAVEQDYQEMAKMAEKRERKN